MAFLSPKHLIENLNIKEGSSILDLGAGSGSYVYEICRLNHSKRHDGKVVAVDISKDSLDRVKDSAAIIGYPIDTLVADLEEVLILPDYSFDYIIMANTLHAIKNKQRLMSECKRVLAPNGYMLLVEWKEDINLNIGPKEHVISRTDLEHIIHKSSFKIVKELNGGDFHLAFILKY
jgi:ubiquinone/menaquinone biosynthesis C-methylase UbiE